jgi:hypothetical protein
MKKTLLAVLLALSFGGVAAQAAGIGGNAGISGQLNVYGGSVTGTGNIDVTGQSVTAAQIGNSGTSSQHADNTTVGGANIGGVINAGGASVIGSVTEVSDSHAFGTTSGNAPSTDITGSQLNASAAYGEANTHVIGASNFGTGAIGASLDVAGYAAIQPIH